MSYIKDNAHLTPMVSVIVPVYNVELYLEKCVKSIINQTYNNLEIILIESDSTDKSGKLCDEWGLSDTRIKVVHTKKEGLGLARDVGINLAQGEWICFVDSDDFIHPEYVETLLIMALENECLTSQCGFQRFSNDASVLQSLGDNESEIRLMEYKQYFLYIYRYAQRGHNPFAVWSNIYHKSLFKQLRFNGFRFAEDSAFTPQIIYAAKEKKIAVTDKRLYYYRQRQGSLLNSETSLLRIDRYYAKKTAMDFWKMHGEKEMYSLFYPDYFNCMVMDYIDLAADLPEEHEKYSFLRSRIRENLREESMFFASNTRLHPLAKSLWNELCEAGKEGIILYGFGQYGKEIYRWLRYFGLCILEVWDRSFDREYMEDSIYFRKPHTGALKDIPILILIENRFIALEAQISLGNMGYQSFWLLQSVYDAVKYGKYQEFLPELIENYRSLI